MATGALSNTFVGHVAAIPNNNEYHGVSYHPRSHEAQGRAQAVFDRGNGNRLSGQLEAAGFTIKLDNEKPEPGPNGSLIYSGISNEQSNSENNLPVSYEINDYGPFVLSILTHPSPHYANLGVTLHPGSSRVSVADIKSSLMAQGKPVQKGVNIDINSTGIPKSNPPQEVR